MADLLEAHKANKQTLESIASSLSPSSPSSLPNTSPSSSSSLPNPLLSRTKLKRKTPSKPKSQSKSKAIKQVQAIKADELNVVSGSIGYLDSGIAEKEGEEGEVLDLADRLLEQLDVKEDDGQEEEEEKEVRPMGIPGSDGTKEAGREEGTNGNSPSSGSTKEKISSLFHIGGGSGSTNGDGKKKVSRQQARKLRKAEHVDKLRSGAEAEVAAANDHSIEAERKAIEEGCKKLGVRIKEIEPDGHCLFSAIADQANFLKLSHSNRKETYATTRYWAANFIRKHPNDFLPFLESEEGEEGMMGPAEFERYCDSIERTAEWGGQPEITALSKYFQAPIHVLQAGTDLVKWGDDLPPGRGPMLISFHRKMYGLGEHYQSLRPI